VAGPKLRLSTVTLCAVTSVNVEATIAALRACLDQVDFADCLLLTDAEVVTDHFGIRIVPIAKLDSSRAYSEFILHELAGHIRTAHCLVVQWDGFVLDAGCWDPSFLEYDYIGAPWPQFDDNCSVGNGGFSLRSRKLLEACCDPAFQASHPEDLAICRINRPLLERRFGIRFADRATAGRFAYERGAPSAFSFGFHGVFNMVPALGTDHFWQIYNSLDNPSTAFIDYRALMRQLGHGRHAFWRRLRLSADWLGHLVGRDGHGRRDRKKQD
jgi:hypothetical protein